MTRTSWGWQHGVLGVSEGRWYRRRYDERMSCHCEEYVAKEIAIDRSFKDRHRSVGLVVSVQDGRGRTDTSRQLRGRNFERERRVRDTGSNAATHAQHHRTRRAL